MGASSNGQAGWSTRAYTAHEAQALAERVAVPCCGCVPMSVCMVQIAELDDRVRWLNQTFHMQQVGRPCRYVRGWHGAGRVSPGLSTSASRSPSWPRGVQRRSRGVLLRRPAALHVLVLVLFCFAMQVGQLGRCRAAHPR